MYRFPVCSSHISSMNLACSIMAFVHDSSVLYVLQYRFVILEYRFLCSFPCTLSINKPSVYFSPSPRKEREDPVVPVSLVEHFSPTLLELCFSNPVSYYWDWYISLFRAKDYILTHSSQFIQSLHRDKPVRPIFYYLHGLGHSWLFWWGGILCFLIAWIYFYTVLFSTTAWFLL